MKIVIAEGIEVMAKRNGKSEGYIGPDVIGTSHSARLAGGHVPSTPKVAPSSELDTARNRKRLRERTLLSSTDAFRGKND